METSILILILIFAISTLWIIYDAGYLNRKIDCFDYKVDNAVKKLNEIKEWKEHADVRLTHLLNQERLLFLLNEKNNVCNQCGRRIE